MTTTTTMTIPDPQVSWIEIEEMSFQIRTRLSPTNRTPHGAWFWTVVAEDHDYIHAGKRGWWSQRSATEAATAFLERTFSTDA